MDDGGPFGAVDDARPPDEGVRLRVPVAALFENLKDGATVDEFLAWFPGVSRNQVETVLDFELAAVTATLQA